MDVLSSINENLLYIALEDRKAANSNVPLTPLWVVNGTTNTGPNPKSDLKPKSGPKDKLV